VAEREASGEFDYLIGDLAEADVSNGDDAFRDQVPAQDADNPPRGDYHWDEPQEPACTGDDEGDADRSFDAFDENTWYFEPAPAPWYRTKQAITALIATATAAIALVVSGVLLLFGGPGNSVESTTSVTPTAPSTVASSESASSPEAPPPPATSAQPIAPPAETYRPQPTRSTKPPEIGVTRTPVTRSPLSVAPQRPGPRPATP
jgi:hypothetical protein